MLQLGRTTTAGAGCNGWTVARFYKSTVLPKPQEPQRFTGRFKQLFNGEHHDDDDGSQNDADDESIQ